MIGRSTGRLLHKLRYQGYICPPHNGSNGNCMLALIEEAELWHGKLGTQGRVERMHESFRSKMTNT